MERKQKMQRIQKIQRMHSSESSASSDSSDSSPRVSSKETTPHPANFPARSTEQRSGRFPCPNRSKEDSHARVLRRIHRLSHVHRCRRFLLPWIVLENDLPDPQDRL